MPRKGQSPIYHLTRVGRNYHAETIYRNLGHKTAAGVFVVRFERFWQPLHEAKELKKFITIKMNRKGSRFLFDSKPFPHGYEPKPFVKDWEVAIGLYPTFGPRGT